MHFVPPLGELDICNTVVREGGGGDPCVCCSKVYLLANGHLYLPSILCQCFKKLHLISLIEVAVK